MMKKQLIILFILCAFIRTQAQQTQLNGLEIYNPQVINPAFTGAKDLIQADIRAFDYRWYAGSSASIMAGIPETGSSIGLSIAGSKLYNITWSSERSDDDIYGKSSTVALSYAYKHDFSDIFSLSGGFRYSYSQAIYLDTAFTNTLSVNSDYLEVGLALTYKKFYAGVSAGAQVFRKTTFLDENELTATSWKYFNWHTVNFIAGYSFSGRRRVQFDPFVGYFQSNIENAGFYAGGNCRIVKTVGLGFTVGTLNSLSASVTIKDRFILMVGIVNFAKNAYDNNSPVRMQYSLDFDPLNYIAQIRISL